MTARHGTDWTEDEDALLRRLWLHGATCLEIAGALGTRTRNMVIGRVRRLELPRRFDRTPNPIRVEQAWVRRTRPVTVVDTRSAFARWMGDPLPGRSALDRKKNKSPSVRNPIEFVASGLLASHIEDRHSNSEAVE